MLRARPRPSSSNQFEKLQSQRDCDKAAEAIFPVDFPALTACTRKCICECATCVPKTAERVPWTRIVSFASASHWEHHEISARKPKTMTVKVMYSRGKKTASKCCLTYAGPMCYLLQKLPFPPLPTLLPCRRAHRIKIGCIKIRDQVVPSRNVQLGREYNWRLHRKRVRLPHPRHSVSYDWWFRQ